MKKLFLTLSITLLGFVSHTQKIFIESEYRQVQWKFGVYEDINIILDSSDMVYESILKPLSCVFDLSKRTMLVDHEDDSQTIVNNLQIEKNGDIYVINYLDAGLPITIYLDVSEKIIRYLYYTEVTNTTWLHTISDIMIEGC
jgi:hypothetical protein